MKYCRRRFKARGYSPVDDQVGSVGGGGGEGDRWRARALLDCTSIRRVSVLLRWDVADR